MRDQQYAGLFFCQTMSEPALLKRALSQIRARQHGMTRGSDKMEPCLLFPFSDAAANAGLLNANTNKIPEPVGLSGSG